MQQLPIRESGSDVARGANSQSVCDVLIVDDHPLMCDALTVTLSHAFGLRRVRTAASLAAAQASIRADGVPDAVVLDLNLPDVAGAEGVLSLRMMVGDTPITVISAEFESRMVAALLAAGVRGYILKTLARPRMIEAFETMWAGGIVTPDAYNPDDLGEDKAVVALARDFATLTPQQLNILRLICQGRPNKLISYELSIAEATVKTHIAAIMSKINVSNRTQVALLANKARLFVR